MFKCVCVMTVCQCVFMMKLVLLLALLSVSDGDGSRVVGQPGEDVTLPCMYDIKHYGALSVCWGRGEIPNSGCNNQLISTDGQKVTKGTRVSSRYQLLGRLDNGDVSLTILNVSERDAGRYGCRVEIPGLFNDLKYHIDLTVEEAPLTTSWTTLNTETSTEQTAAENATGHVNSTARPLTSSSSSVMAEDSRGESVVLLCVLFGLVALVTAGAVLIVVGRRRRLNKMPQQQQQQQQVVTSVQFSATSSTLQLQNRALAVENIYQIDGGVDGSEYEYCP